MPFGSSEVLGYLVDVLVVHRPARVLDLGIGLGANGFAVRNFLDNSIPAGPTYLVGVEVWPAYRNPLWGLYDGVEVGPLPGAIAQQGDWDAILLTDVIEHLEKAQGAVVLEHLKRQLSPRGIVFVSTPAIWMPQGAYAGNPHETHRSLWTADDFHELGYRTIPDACHRHAMLVALHEAGPS